MENKKGMVQDYLGWMLLGLGLLFLASIIIFSNKNALSSILSGLKF